MTVKLIWDGGTSVIVPSEMGQPHSGQMTGTTGERLTELACRVCYDSVGTGRATSETLAHVLEARHLSVLEHFNKTVSLDFASSFGSEMLGGMLLFPGMFNRPGLWVRPVIGGLRITLNARVVYEWNQWLSALCETTDRRLHPLYDGAAALGNALWELWRAEMPLIFEDRSVDMATSLRAAKLDNIAFARPETDNERWISLYVRASRGLSHELVRHGDWTAISQRSTRYVDEDESDWAWHPAIDAYRRSHPQDLLITEAIFKVEDAARAAYQTIRDALEPWLRESCEIKRDARKQARGAARGALGNALSTELVFSASVHQWRHILQMRGATGADAEIRCMAADAVRLLRSTRYASSFADFVVRPSPDGVGEITELAS